MSKKSASPLHEHGTAAAPAVRYDSNPFSVLIGGTDRLFRVNQTAAIIVLVISVVFGVLQFVADMIRAIISSATSSSSQQTYDTSSVLGASTASGPEIAGVVAIVLIVIAVVLVLLAISAVFGVLYNGMLAYVVLCTIRNQKANFSEGWTLITKNFWRILFGTMYAQLKVFGGLLLFIVPGIRAAMRYNMLTLYILDKQVGVQDSHNAMKAITRGRLLEIFSVTSWASLVPLAAQVVAMGGQVKQYEQLVGTHEAGQQRPSVHWLNWLVIIIPAVFAVLIFGIAALVFLISMAQ